MTLVREEFHDRESWLAGRQRIGIGASEAAAVCGLSPWMTPVELWKIKTGQKNPKDLSGNPATERGHRLEPAVRGIFAAQHPELTVDYHEFDILHQEERPWLFATLDGELIREDGTRGILEIKTSAPANAAKFAEWKNQIPPAYYCQVCHQMAATEYNFVILAAWLMLYSGDRIYREYEFRREDCEDDIAWLIGEEEKFMGYIGRKRMPPMTLRL